MAEFFTIKGVEDAIRALEQLSKDMRRRVVNSSLREAAKPIVKAAKGNAPVRTGLLKRRIVVTTSKLARRRREIGVFIQPRATAKVIKAKLRSSDPYYYKFVEKGYHATGRAKRKNAPNARFIPGKQFLGNAFQSQKSAAVSAFQRALARHIEQANRRK